MAIDIRMIKLVTGDIVIGKYNKKNTCLDEVAIIQTVPVEKSMQMLILPYGYPFEPKYTGSISSEFFMYKYESTPEELQKKYLEAIAKVEVSGGLGKLQFSENAPTKVAKQ